MIDPGHTDLLRRVKTERLPKHVAIILDGNGRWAKARGLSRTEGHRAGGENLDRLLDFIVLLKIPAVSLYAFSTENWKRPRPEVAAIWSLLDEFFRTRLHRCLENGIRIRTSGDLARLPAKARGRIEEAQAATAKMKRLVANFCVNYGSQDEILEACSRVVRARVDLALAGKTGRAARNVGKKEFERELYTYPLPPVDLLVRPGGESRISNFLLWQCAYAEIYVTPVLFPDFDREQLVRALEWYQTRERRFGGL